MIKNLSTGESIVKMTPDEYAEHIKQSKPYLVELEQKVEGLDYGDILVRITVRAGVVDKMQYIESNKTWMKPKSSI